MMMTIIKCGEVTDHRLLDDNNNHETVVVDLIKHRLIDAKVK